MNHSRTARNRRILIVNDNEPIHADFRTVPAGEPGTAAIDEDASDLFSTACVASVAERSDVPDCAT